jgi:sugar O-acyltransferase (sialic acid O-acetyltransferase NeuD family)
VKRKILIFSAGPGGREVYNLIKSINKDKKIKFSWEVLGYVDDKLSKTNKKIDNLNVFSIKNCPKGKNIFATTGISDPKVRKKIYNEEIINKNYKLTNLIHPSVEVPKCLNIGFGNIIFNNVHISFDISIADFSIISNFCDLGHNLKVKNFFTLMPSSTIGGKCEIGANTFIASGVNIHQNLTIGNNCMIGIGSTVTSNIQSNFSLINYPRQVLQRAKK